MQLLLSISLKFNFNKIKNKISISWENKQEKRFLCFQRTNNLFIKCHPNLARWHITTSHLALHKPNQTNPTNPFHRSPAQPYGIFVNVKHIRKVTILSDEFLSNVFLHRKLLARFSYSQSSLWLQLDINFILNNIVPGN